MRVHPRAPRDQWRAVLAEDPLALPEHAPEWVDAVCAGGPYTDATRLYEFPDGRRFVLPLVRRTGLAGVPGQLWSLPHSWGLGGLVGPDLDAGAIRAVVGDLAALPAVRVVVRPDPLRKGWECIAGHPKVHASPRRAHVLDLVGGVDGVRARLGSLTRRNLRTAERLGVRVELDRDGSLLPIYHRHYDLSVDRWAAKQNEPLALARWRAARRDPVGKFDLIAKHLGEAFRHYVAFDGDTPAASIIVLFGRTASYSRGAMDRDVAGPVRANDLLHWTAIQDACAAGCTHYHMLETGESESLARFKERLGAVPIDYCDYRIERVPLTKADKKLRSAVKKVIGFRDTDNAAVQR
ncbi:GNAT family N-acetyltransferase [Pseudonocardia kunmingensis]|uniref:GNAT family N-acetyltransferase n=1 Tax=Pseudonocardia kunmingensis TaxID=630975 RepID=UPI00114FFE10|nr:GNAT family N-acetyltransferase [Pseudonocardia kunmingensis]